MAVARCRAILARPAARPQTSNIIPGDDAGSRLRSLTGGASATYGARGRGRGELHPLIPISLARVDGQQPIWHNNRIKVMPPLLDARAGAGSLRDTAILKA